MRSVLEMMDVHAGLHELFAVHRDHVVGLEFSLALAALGRFETELRRHMSIEEEHILPLYVARVGHVLGGDPQFFYLEHENILRNLETAKGDLRRLIADPKAGRRLAFRRPIGEIMFISHPKPSNRRASSANRQSIVRRCRGVAPRRVQC